METLSVIIPAFNIEKTIERVYKLTRKELGLSTEIIISEDGSTDNTRNIINKLKNKDKKLVVLTNNKKLGKGGGLIRGFNKASGENIVFIDGDLSINPKEIKKIVKFLKDYDFVLGSRRLKESRISEDQPLARKILGLVYRKIVKLLFNINILDTQCGLKGFKKYVYEKIKPLSTKGWSLDLEMIVKAKNNGFKIKEVPIEWTDSGQTTLNPIKASMEMLKDIFRIKFNN